MDRWLMYMKKAALLHEQRSLLKTVFGCELKNQTADSTVCKELLYGSKGQLCNAKGLLYDS